MPNKGILYFIKQLRRPVFTTNELSNMSGRSLSTTVQALNFLQKQGLIFKIYRGIWAEANDERLTPYILIPFLFPRDSAYLSFISALHLHGIIEQIPQTITVASTAHTKAISTKLGTFYAHRLHPLFFGGFSWYKGTGGFLIAEPEKALVDSLYISTRKKRQFSYFPEMHFPSSFSFKKAEEWVKKIPNSKIRASVQKKLNAFKRK